MILEKKVQLESQHGERLEEEKELFRPAAAKPLAENQEGCGQVQRGDQFCREKDGHVQSRVEDAVKHVKQPFP